MDVMVVSWIMLSVISRYFFCHKPPLSFCNIAIYNNHVNENIGISLNKANGGIDTERAYPYDGEEEQCHFSRSDIGATDKGN